MPIIPTRPLVVSMLNNKGALQIENQEYGKARKSLNKALRMVEKSDQIRRSKQHRVARSPSPSNDSTATESTAASSTNISDSSSVDSSSSFSSSSSTTLWPSSQDFQDSLSSLFRASTSITETTEESTSSSDDASVYCDSSTGNNSKTPFKHRAEYDEGMDYFNTPLRLTDSSRNIDGTILFNLGRLEHSHGNFDEALDLYKRALKSVDVYNVDDSYNNNLRQQSSGVLVGDEPLTLALLVSIGQIQYLRGDHDDALKTYQTSLSLAKAAFGDDSLEAAACHNCIGVLHYIMPDGESSVALESLQTALTIRKSMLGREHIHVGTTYNNIGRIFFQQGMYADAMNAYQRALDIRRTVQGESVDVAATLFNVGQVYHQQQMREEALAHYKDFLKLAKKHFGDYHRDVCIVTTCMGQVFHEQKDFDKALKSFHHALKVGRIALGPVHSEVAITLVRLPSASSCCTNPLYSSCIVFCG